MRNKILGSTLIIAGTAIGAGMLAMPLTAAQMGFKLTLALLSLLWLLLTFTALLYAEVHQHNSYNAGIAALSEQYLGKVGRLFVNFILLFFLYALLTAYIMGSGDLLYSLMPKTLFSAENQARQLSSLFFVFIFGGLIATSISIADLTNRLLFVIKLLLFITILYLLFRNIELPYLTVKPVNSLLFFSAMPIFFMTFGFHICTPTINEYLKGNNRLLKLACFLGASSVFLIYIIWQLATHGILEQGVLTKILKDDPSLNGLIDAFKITTGSHLIGETVRLFSLLALTTSFIGVALGQLSAVKDMLTYFKISHNRLLLGLLTFSPPIVIGFTYPQLFLSAFAFAGIIFAFIGIILPVLLAYKSRQHFPQGKQIPGGNLSLGLALLAALIIMVAYLLSIFTKVLPPVIS